MSFSRDPCRQASLYRIYIPNYLTTFPESIQLNEDYVQHAYVRKIFQPPCAVLYKHNTLNDFRCYTNTSCHPHIYSTNARHEHKVTRNRYVLSFSVCQIASSLTV